MHKVRRIGPLFCTPMAPFLTLRISTRGYFMDMCSFEYSNCCIFPHAHCSPQTLHAIYTGKSSAFTGYRLASKPSQAEIHDMHEVFPEAVAYAAVQVRLNFEAFNFNSVSYRLIMAFRPSNTGVCTTATLDWMFSSGNVSSCSLRTQPTNGLKIPSIS